MNQQWVYMCSPSWTPLTHPFEICFNWCECSHSSLSGHFVVFFFFFFCLFLSIYFHPICVFIFKSATSAFLDFEKSILSIFLLIIVLISLHLHLISLSIKICCFTICFCLSHLFLVSLFFLKLSEYYIEFLFNIPIDFLYSYWLKLGLFLNGYSRNYNIQP